MKKNIIFLFLMLITGLIIFKGCRPPGESIGENVEIGAAKVSLQLQWVTQAQFAGYYTALEKGWYKDEGIDLSIYPGAPDIVPVDLVAAGSRDFGTTLLADLAVEIQRGKEVISIAQIQQNNGLRLLAKKSSHIKRPKDFTGKKVGVWLGGWETQFNALLALEKIAPEDVEVISQGFSMAPFLDGRLDVASAMIYNEYYVVLASGMDKEALVVIDYADYGLGFLGDVLFTSQKVRTKHPDLCLKMARASIKGWQYALDHQDEAADIVVKHDRTGIAKTDHQQKMMGEIALLVRGDHGPQIGRADTQAISRMVELLVRQKQLDRPIPVERIYTPEFIEQIGR